MRAAIHDASGRILRIVTAPAGQIGANVGSGEDWIDAGHDVWDDTHQVVQHQAVALPARTRDTDTFDYGAQCWIRNEPLEWSRVRGRRNGLLAASDWTDTVSAKQRLGDSAWQHWQDYRQQLRDLTDQADPAEISWPQPPA